MPEGAQPRQLLGKVVAAQPHGDGAARPDRGRVEHHLARGLHLQFGDEGVGLGIGIGKGNQEGAHALVLQRQDGMGALAQPAQQRHVVDGPGVAGMANPSRSR